MKTILTAVAAMMLLAACDTAPQGGCSDCEKMAREAKIAHDAKMAGKKDCECCKGKKHAH